MLAAYAYRCAVANLQRLKNVEHELGSLLTHEEADAIGSSVVDLPSAVDGAGRGRNVWQDTSETDVVGLSGHTFQAEGFANGLLCPCQQA